MEPLRKASLIEYKVVWNPHIGIGVDDGKQTLLSTTTLLQYVRQC